MKATPAQNPTTADNDKLCHICGLPRAEKGGPVCSYPHGRLPVRNPDNWRCWIWDEKLGRMVEIIVGDASEKLKEIDNG